MAVSACAPNRALAPIVPPAAKMQREAAGTRPKIPAEHVIDWTKVQTVAQARGACGLCPVHRTRQGMVAGYVVQIEGRLFTSSSNVTWLRDFYAALPS